MGLVAHNRSMWLYLIVNGRKFEDKQMSANSSQIRTRQSSAVRTLSLDARQVPWTIQGISLEIVGITGFQTLDDLKS